jgi:hypothetical protein
MLKASSNRGGSIIVPNVRWRARGAAGGGVGIGSAEFQDSETCGSPVAGRFVGIVGDC